MKNRFDKRIAIIGAGPAGLGAAEALREKGYTNITVFDKSTRVGGQSLTCTYLTPDNRELVYDIGSIQPLGSKTLKRLLKKYGLGFGRGPLAKKSKLIYAYSYINDSEFVNYLKYYAGVPLKQLPAVASDLAKLSYYLWRYRRLAKPGFYNFKHLEETSVNFREWVEERKFKVLGDKLIALIISLLTLSNKENESQIKLYFVFKAIYTMLLLPMRYIDGTYKPIKEGYQELWNRVARNFALELGTTIKSITRDEAGVTLTTATSTHRFDELIISCPFDKIARCIDVRPAESENFRNILYNPGYRAAFVAKNGPMDAVHWFPDSLTTGTTPPYLTFIIPEGKVAEDTYLYSCLFSHCPFPNAVELIKQSAEKVMGDHFGAKITEWVKMQYWADYGCLFDVEMARRGVYDNIQAMQGNFNTYYTGQLISMNGHAATVEYSYELVDLFY